MGLLDTKTKAKFTMLDSLVAVANTIVAGYGLPLTIPQAPEVQDATSLVIWGVQVFAMVAVYFTPTIITHLSVKKYVEVKAAQNIEGIKAGTVTPDIAPVVETPVVVEPDDVVPIEEQIALIKRLVLADPWSYIKGSVQARLAYLTDLMQKEHPEWDDPTMAQKVIEKYIGVKLTAKDCEMVNSILGLSAVVKQWSSIKIIADFCDACEFGRLPKWLCDKFVECAVERAVDSTISNAQNDVWKESPKADKEKALRVFGLSDAEIAKTVWGGGSNVWVWQKFSKSDPNIDNGRFKIFNAWSLLGIPDGRSEFRLQG